MGQFAKTGRITWIGVIRSKPFRRGFDEARSGKPIDYDAFDDDINAQWHYERGRAFGIVWDGVLMKGIHVLPEAVEACQQAYEAGAFI